MSTHCRFMISIGGMHFTFVLLTLAVAGCSTHVALKKDVQSSIRTAEVSQEVKVPDRITVMRNLYFGGAAGFLLSLLDRPDKEKAEKMEEMLRMEIPKIVHERFSSALREGKLFERVTDGSSQAEKPDAVFFLTIDSYGFQGQKPLLCATGRLILNPPVTPTWSRNGTAAKWTIAVENPEMHPSVWEKRACEFGQFVELPTEDVKFYANNPDITRGAFTKASQSVVDQLINDMRENYE